MRKQRPKVRVNALAKWSMTAPIWRARRQGTSGLIGVGHSQKQAPWTFQLRILGSTPGWAVVASHLHRSVDFFWSQ